MAKDNACKPVDLPASRGGKHTGFGRALQTYAESKKCISSLCRCTEEKLWVDSRRGRVEVVDICRGYKTLPITIVLLSSNLGVLLLFNTNLLSAYRFLFHTNPSPYHAAVFLSNICSCLIFEISM